MPSEEQRASASCHDGTTHNHPTNACFTRADPGTGPGTGTRSNARPGTSIASTNYGTDAGSNAGPDARTRTSCTDPAARGTSVNCGTYPSTVRCRATASR